MRLTLITLAIALLPGCGPTITPSFDSPEPAARNAAIVRAAESRDASATANLVKMLDSDDPATRVLAIAALQRITGQTQGYDPYADAVNREPAMRAWRTWLQEQ
jgi:hypothetical protein